MTLFFIGVAILIAGYFIYGSFMEKVFAPTDTPTPAHAMADGVDYVELPLWRIVMIQFLNIAGLGPIYGAITGALFGPSAFIWIVVGNIFVGAAHDYIVGITSIRNKGMTVGELVGQYLGIVPKHAMRVISLILLLLVGVVFTSGPAAVLFGLFKSTMSSMPEWLTVRNIFYIIMIYYFMAAFLPIDKIIAPLYPFFGAILLFTAIALLIRLLTGGYTLPAFNGLANTHPGFVTAPGANAIFPFLFVTIACGACSGFHATQTPLMARCVGRERDARMAFYGAMIIEGILAMIWASVPMAFFHQQAITAGDASPANVARIMLEAGALNNPGGIVNTVSLALLGGFGGALAVIGVVICPITSGDTCFRAIRLQLAEMFNMPQADFRNRLVLVIPIIILGTALSFIDFNILWRYFAFTNQLLAAFALWMGAGYFAANKQGNKHWIATLPAAFMSSVCVAYIMTAKIGFNLPYEIARNVGMVSGVASIFIAHFLVARTMRKDLKKA